MSLTDNLCGVYTVTAIKKKSAVRIKHIDTIVQTKEHQLRDTCIDRYAITEKLFGLVNVCNLSHNFIVSTKKLPILYINVLLERPLNSIQLFSVFLYFTIETDVKSKEEFLNSELDGLFTLEATIDGEQVVLDTINKFPGNSKMLDKIKDFTKTQEMIDLLNQLADQAEDKIRKQFELDYGSFKIPESIISLEDVATDNA
jgi:hypothetical protein